MPERTPFQIIEADWQTDRTAIQLVRRAVFVREQGIPEALEWDGLDDSCRHVLAITTTQEPVGTGRLLADGRIGRMAVLEAWRGKGVGKAILAALLQLAEFHHLPLIYLHAQVQAVDFYLKTGFETVGSPFTEAGIEHIRLEKTLRST